MSAFGIIDFDQSVDLKKLKIIVKTMSEGENTNIFPLNNCVVGSKREKDVSIASDKERIVIFYGELYNKDELTHNDGESANIILEGFSAYNDAIFSKIKGSYFVVLIDCKEKSAILCRDRIGTKELYYCRAGKKVIFSSTLKNVLRSKLVKKEIDKEAFSQFLQLTYIPAPKSIISGVKKVCPAHFVKINLEEEVNKEYWDINYCQDNFVVDYQQAKKELREKVFSSVEKRMVNGEKTGAFLSGGFDSSIVLGVMSQISDKPIDAFTIGFSNKHFDETSLASIVAKKNNAKHHIITLNEEKAVDNIRAVLKNMDEPYADSSLIATYLVCNEAKEFVDVAFLGDAGDELFAGYNKYLIGYYNKLYNKVPKFIKNVIVKPAAKIFPVRSTLGRKINKFLSIAEQDVFEQRKRLLSLGFKSEEIVKLTPNIDLDKMEFLFEYYNKLNNADEQTRAQYLDLKVVLEGDMTRKTERATEMAGFRTRAPLLGEEIVDFSYNIPTRFKIKGKQRKIILKETFKDLLPKQLFGAPKSGFSVPISFWFDTILKQELTELSDKRLLERQGLFDYDYIKTIIEAHMNKRENRASELWVFCVFQRWYLDNIEN